MLRLTTIVVWPRPPPSWRRTFGRTRQLHVTEIEQEEEYCLEAMLHWHDRSERRRNLRCRNHTLLDAIRRPADALSVSRAVWLGGTGKLGDLAGFSGAIVLAMIALLIGYESVSRFFAPVPIQFSEAIPIACLGLAVNVASVWLLSSGPHDHGHGHHHSPDDHDHDYDEEQRIPTGSGSLAVSILEDGVPSRFRVRFEGMDKPRDLTITTVRHRQFACVPYGRPGRLSGINRGNSRAACL